MPKYQKAGTGIRLLDDLTGAGPVAGATPPTTPQMRAATTYETYVQPAVLGLRNAVTSVFGDGSKDLLGGLSPAPLAMANAGKPIASVASGMATDAVDGLKRMLRESHTIDRLENYRRQFDPVTMAGIEQFAERQPRILDKLALQPMPEGIKARGSHAAYLDPIDEASKVQLRSFPGDTPEHILQALEHESRHYVDARRLGPEKYAQRVSEEAALPYLERPGEKAAFSTQFGRAAERHEAQQLGRKLTPRERLTVRDRETFRRGGAPEPTLPMWTGGLPQPDDLVSAATRKR
jgi:hypothetical protein